MRFSVPGEVFLRSPIELLKYFGTIGSHEDWDIMNEGACKIWSSLQGWYERSLLEDGIRECFRTGFFRVKEDADSIEIRCDSRCLPVTVRMRRKTWDVEVDCVVPPLVFWGNVYDITGHPFALAEIERALHKAKERVGNLAKGEIRCTQ